MINWSKYVGIPWEFNSSSFSGADCLGLLKLVYKDQDWEPDFDDGKPIEKDWYVSSPNRLVNYLCRHFDKVDDVNLLEPGDIIYFRINGEGHVGIWIDFGKFLHTYPPSNSLIKTASYIERFRYIEKAFVCGFKRRE